MPFQITDQLDLAAAGLVADVPANNTNVSAWSDVLDMRAKDDSIQGVYAFEAGFTFDTTFANVTSISDVVALTQWTPSGSSFLNIAYVLKDDANKGRVFVRNLSTNATVEITNGDLSATFTIDDKYPPQIFVFNELLIVNPATGTPQFTSAGIDTAGTLQDLPNWLTYGAVGSTYPAIARIIKPFGNRLVAMSFVDDKDSATAADDDFQAIDFAWSSNITGVASLGVLFTAAEVTANGDVNGTCTITEHTDRTTCEGAMPEAGVWAPTPTISITDFKPNLGAAWQASTTNTAGDARLADTPGRILDGEILGEFFIAYKSDAVVRVREIGEPLVLGFESIFEDDGIYSTRCIANIGNSQHIVMGNYGMYIHNGQSEKVDIAKGKFQEALFDSVRPADKERTFIFRQTRDKEVWFCFKDNTVANTNLGCNRAFVYDYESQKVHKRSLPDVTDIYETEVNGELRVFAASPESTSVLELKVDKYVADGFVTIQDKDMGDPSSVKHVIAMYVATEDDVIVSLEGTLHIADPKTYPLKQDFKPLIDYKLNIRERGRYFNLRIDMSGTKNPKLTTLAFKVRTTGKR